MEPLSMEELKMLVFIGRKDFLTGTQKDRMVGEMSVRREFGGIGRKSTGEYLGNKIRSATYPQLKVCADWIREEIGDECFVILRTQAVSSLHPQTA